MLSIVSVEKSGIFAINVVDEDQQDRNNGVKAFLLEHYRREIHIIDWEQTKSIHLKGVWKVPVHE